MKTIVIIAGKELRDGFRNRWVFTAIALLASLALVLALVGSAPVGAIKASPLSATVASLSSLGVYLLPLIALMLSYNALVGEFEHGTMLLLLTYPVPRWQVVIGKFVGHVSILTFAIVIGYGLAGMGIALTGGADAQGWTAFAALIGSSILLGAIFIALGYLISALTTDGSKAAGMAIGLWILLVVMYDLTLLGVLIADKGEMINEQLFAWLMLFNPTDAYRVFNLTTFKSVSASAGLAGVGLKVGIGAMTSLTVMAAWCAAPLAATLYVFQRQEI
jgi:Cu-processing system permease protein